ncbi:hypothetical protein [Phytohabitans aurantiacus]|jgi:hypothetical protein|uniref:Uncharacterized protein n=1 Tax=Phytohabitans aurantiacus TaxID=3016789 RepID=A0ABQ5QPB0_9ACTN|nr:hypothetical protein [Phytohabitans aurantiacus]GLH96491.1 hypothetical protein Pa4123_17650 [Phytohabitans aurantiacus]
MHRRVGDRTETLLRLGDTFDATLDTVHARGVRREALSIFDDLGHPDAEQMRARLGS